MYRGENGKSGKVGHNQLIRGGEECYCGRRGCFNTLCNQKKLEAAGGGSVEDFFAKLGAGDDYCQRVWEDYLQSLAEGITTLRMLFDSQVIIGGVIADYIVPCFEKLVDKKDGWIRLMIHIPICALVRLVVLHRLWEVRKQ